jgi:UV DNA damage endonuclease
LDTVRREGIEYVKALGLQNARDILPMLKWNEANHIKFVRLSSEMFPYEWISLV